LGLVQVGTEPYEVETNRALTVNGAREAFQKGADFVVLPEMAVQGYTADARRLAPVAEPLDGPTVAAWTDLARDHNGYICGGFCEREGEALHNTAVLVGPEGLLLHYRKLHRFADEKVSFQPGDKGLPVARTRFGTVGICVCYDLRFVEVVRILALKGADLILVPTAWLRGFDSEQWDDKGMCPQARDALLQSNLNQVFIACASQAGQRGDLEFLGSSIVANPLGKLACGPLPGSVDEVSVVEVDLALAQTGRIRSTLIAPRADRRTDVYGISIDGTIL
jgi:predicted amidohydrolase